MKNRFHRCAGAACLEIKGGDACRFLQGQFTNDLRSNTANICTYDLWLDRKGKIQGDSAGLGMGPKEYRIFSYDPMGEALCERLEAHIIADDAEGTDWTDSMEVISIPDPDGEINGMAMVRTKLAGDLRVGMNVDGESEARVFAGTDAKRQG